MNMYTLNYSWLLIELIHSYQSWDQETSLHNSKNRWLKIGPNEHSLLYSYRSLNKGFQLYLKWILKSFPFSVHYKSSLSPLEFLTLDWSTTFTLYASITWLLATYQHFQSLKGGKHFFNIQHQTACHYYQCMVLMRSKW